MQKIETQEIEVYKSQVSQLEQQANKLSIASPEENAIAIQLKATLDKTWKEIKLKKETITKPLNEALKNARALFAPIEEIFENADSSVGRKLLDYKRKVDEDARKAEAKIAADLESGKIKKIETAERRIENLEQVQKTTHTQAGDVQFRKIKKVRITSLDLLPDAYWIVDEVKLRKDVLAGIVVPGAEMFEVETV